MLFHSLTYFVFLPAVVVLYFAVVPPRWRWLLLLVASWTFYAAWKPAYLILLLVSTTIDYVAGIAMGRVSDSARRRPFLALSLAANFGLLFTFKYLDFFGETLERVAGLTGVVADIPELDLVLPVGISFYTFQTVGYAIDVYRGARPPETHFGRFALYVSFFPQLVAGPIERSTALLPQLWRTHAFDANRLVTGLGLILWGLFKKVVIADRAAVVVDAVYASPESFQGPTIVVATYVFAFQIYCDFSGYTDIAIGSARILGYDLMENFRQPYWATSVADFWRRWHISLSTWFRDYVYVPLGGSQRGAARRVVALGAVFLLSGLWHGANWTFVLWGAFHGALIIAGVAARAAWRRLALPIHSEIVRRVWGAVAMVTTFHLVCVGWMMFRADDLAHLSRLSSQLTVVIPVSVMDELGGIGPGPRAATIVELGILLLSIALLELGEIARARGLPTRTTPIVRGLAGAALAVWVALMAVQSHSPFIYFQF